MIDRLVVAQLLVDLHKFKVQRWTRKLKLLKRGRVTYDVTQTDRVHYKKWIEYVYDEGDTSSLSKSIADTAAAMNTLVDRVIHTNLSYTVTAQGLVVARPSRPSLLCTIHFKNIGPRMVIRNRETGCWMFCNEDDFDKLFKYACGDGPPPPSALMRDEKTLEIIRISDNTP